MHRFLFTLAIAIVAVPGARAAHPLLTEDTRVQGQGNYQLEMMAEGQRDRPPGARVRTLQLEAVLSHGIAEDADLQFGIPWLRQRVEDASGSARMSGAGDAAMDLKWRFYRKGSFSLAVKPGITLPTGDEARGLGTGRAGWGSLAIVSWEPRSLALHAHAGYQRNRNSLGERESLNQLSGSAVYRARDQLKLVAELTRETSPDPAQSYLRVLVIGGIWSVTEYLDLSAGWRRGSGAAAGHRALLLGATFAW